MARVVFIQESSEGLMYIEFYLVVLKNVSGLYQYVKISNPTNATIGMGEFRTVHRFDHNLMPKISNMVRSGETPDLTDRPTIQDTTWQLADGSYWSKYDFCGYIRETPWMGVYGGGFGAWIVSASREYHSGGPLKQELLVHQDSLMLNYFHSGHFGTPGLETPPGWSKFYGPYLIYINIGSEEEVLQDVANQAIIEQAQWPYIWIDDKEYPLKRGSVSGKVTGQLKAMVVVYDSTQEEFDLQTLGYLYNTETDSNGGFVLNNIRPGNYQIVAYPLAGHGIENIARKNITVTEEALDVGLLDLPEPNGILWSIGETNRRSDVYHYSDELRNFYWHLLPPANLTFEIGKSDIGKHWYYAQTRTPGVWNIAYTDQPDGKDRILRVAFAAASSSASIDIELNGDKLGHFAYENDMTLYRDALQSGRFHPEKLTVAAKQIVNGRNNGIT
ncbi:hypothetical protein ABEB36_002362 [Hypothenemus hampei]|uniref:rhamnogalacturonan endolyase n=1 Tax=Hypothenemus hampei TaxID=57062 RepID=A0ABD1F5H0_HYPHA